MKKQNWLKFLFLLAFPGLMAQQGSVSGIVVDDESGEGIPYASVALFIGGDPTPVTGGGIG